MNGLIVAVIAAIAGTALWRVLVLAEATDASAGRISPRSPEFLYMMDFWTNRWAVVTLTIVDVAVALWIFQGGLSPWQLGMVVLEGITLSVVFTYLFYSGTTGSKRRRGDSAVIRSKDNTKWVLTFGGKFHLGYFFIQAAICLMALFLLLFQVRLVFPFTLAVIGVGLFAATWVRDYKLGLMNP